MAYDVTLEIEESTRQQRKHQLIVIQGRPQHLSLSEAFPATQPCINCFKRSNVLIPFRTLCYLLSGFC